MPTRGIHASKLDEQVAAISLRWKRFPAGPAWHSILTVAEPCGVSDQHGRITGWPWSTERPLTGVPAARSWFTE